MTRVFRGALATLALCATTLSSAASALPVSWDIDPAQSSFKLTIPDQAIVLGTIAATLKLRNQTGANTVAWNTNTAPVDGFLATNVGAGISSVQFLGGSSTLVGVNTGNYRPNPAAYNTASTNTANTAGQFTNTSLAAGVYAAKINVDASILTNLAVGYITFRNVSYDVASAAIAVGGGGSFSPSTASVGVLDSQLAVDGLSVVLVGQPVPDTMAQSGPISAPNINAALGSITLVSGTTYKIVVPINMPVFLSLSGVNLNATATGQLVGFADIVPEPSTLVLTAMGIMGLAARSRRRSLES